MMLLVDVGNTRIKWGQFHDLAISGHAALTYKDKSVNQLLTAAWAGLPPPDRILVVNVAGVSLADSLSDFCRQQFKQTPEFVLPVRQACGVTNGYERPEQLGADRWAAIIGAHHLYNSGPLCIVDCGTAITIDTVTHEGRHLGGLIAPGLGAMQRALVAAAPVIPAESGGRLTLYARDTRTAVTSGVLYAAAALIRHVTGEIRVQQGEHTKCLLTGGDAERMQSIVRGEFTLAPHLVLEGLGVLAGQQK
jgi:type III pantothenate kinase